MFVSKKILLAVVSGALLLTACGEEVAVKSKNPTASGPITTNLTDNSSAQVKQTMITQVSKKHTVKKGEFLNAIAGRYGVEREALILENAKMLIDEYEDACERAHKKAHKSKSLFCNENYKRSWSNTLLPGWKITIPAAASTSTEMTTTFGAEKVAAITTAVSSLSGDDSLSVLLDVSGSMGSKRQMVAQYVMDTLKVSGKKFAGLYVYSAEVRSINNAIDAPSLREALTASYSSSVVGDTSIENTHKALKYVFANKKATHVLVISDEVGNDWNWSTVKDMKNIIAVCVSNTQGQEPCNDSFKKLSKEATNSKYIQL